MRDYDPTTGRYIQADPLGLVDGASVYGYALQNPGRYIDIFGMQSATADGPMSIPGGQSLPGSGGVGNVIGKIVGICVRGGMVFISAVTYPTQMGDGTCPANGCGIVNNEETGEEDSPAKPEKAPGKPGEKEGYVPPKNWDGEKVKNPNGPDKGYPDKDGNVWVPTGEGGAAHGGPHWDVQFPRGGGYKNVYPGGHTR